MPDMQQQKHTCLMPQDLLKRVGVMLWMPVRLDALTNYLIAQMKFPPLVSYDCEMIRVQHG